MEVKSVPISFVFLLIFIFSCLIFLLHVKIVGSAVWGDGRYYYSYVRSLVIDQDLNFTNEYQYFKIPIVFSNTNQVVNKFTIGPAIFWLPPFIISYFITHIFHCINENVSVDGFSIINQIFVGIGSVLYGCLGLWLTWKWLKQYFPPIYVLIASLGIFLASNLFFYVSIDPINSHSVSFFITSLLFYVLFATNKIVSIRQFITLAILSGFMTLMRMQDAILVLIIFLYLFINNLSSKLSLIRLIWFILSFLLIIALQLLIWYYLYGTFTNPYFLGNEQFIYWKNPQIANVLFSTHNGLFSTTPIIILAVLGLLLLIKKNTNLALLGLILFLFQTYISSSWHAWWGGESYGARFFISLMPIFMLGGTALVAKLNQKIPLIYIIIFINAFIIHNLFSITKFLFIH